MAEAEVVEQFFNQNPLAFDQAAVEDLRAKHGKLPTWANRRWRSEHRGWRGLERVPANPEDPFTKDVLKCVKQPLIDLEMQTQDGFIRHGDLVLCTQTEALKERNDQRRDYFANRQRRAMQRGQSELSQEIAKVSDGQVTIDPKVTKLETTRGQQKMVTSKSLRGGG